MSYLLGYYGGKIGPVGKWIADKLPPHRLYVEPFGGMAGVLLQKPRAAVEVYNDRAGELVNLFRVVREQPDALREALALTPYSRDEYRRAHRQEAGLSELEQARRTYVKVAQGRNGSLVNKGLSTGGKVSNRVADTFINGQNRIPWVCERLRGVVLENRDWEPICALYDSPDTLIYLDPPYELESRNSDDCYLHEMDVTQHQQLLRWCLAAKSMVAISGYESPRYAQLVAAGWECQRMKTISISSATRHKKGSPRAQRTECLWVNPAARRTPTLFCEQAQVEPVT